MAARQDGFSLIEALIAVLVLSVGLLGLGQLQAALWKSAGQLYALSEAYLLSASHLERVLTDPSQISEQRLSTQSPSGYTLFDSSLRTEARGPFTEISVSCHWEDTRGTQAVGLQTAVYQSDSADSQWLLVSD
ncbi:MAG: prepilin-type N-terminal cleavage/methylation domain-containing protein [Gammaproteobacteria bacterium]|jgi:type IV pilus modification protein PilV